MIIRIILAFVFILVINTSLLYSRTVSRTLDKPSVAVVADTTETELSGNKKNEFQYLFIEGIKQRTLGKPDDAIKIFSRCLEIDPKSSATLFEMANIHVSRGDFQSSMMMCEKAVFLNPGNVYYHQLLVKIYLQNKLYDQAAKEYTELIRLSPDEQDYKFQRAAVLAMGGKTVEALSAYDTLEASMGLIEPVAIGRQQIYIQQGNRKAGYAEIQKLVDLYPAEPKYYGLLADMYLADKNSEKALEYYNRILQIDPSDGFVHLSIANYYLENKDFEKAFDHVVLAFENSRLELETKAQMFLILTQPGETRITDEKQLRLLNALIDTHIDDERPRSLLVDYLLSKKQTQEARKQLRLVLDMKKDNYLYWERLLFIDNELNEWETLSADSKNALEYFPDQPVIYLLNAVAFLQMKQYDKLLALLDSGEVYAKDNPKILSQFNTYRAEAYHNQKRSREAYAAFEKSIDQDPQNYMAMNNYAYYLSLKGEKLDTAEKLSGTVIQANPDNATYLDTYAWVLFKKKDFELARFYIKSAISKATEASAVLVEHYGDILYFLNEKQSALEQWKKSLGMGNDSKILKKKISRKKHIESEE